MFAPLIFFAMTPSMQAPDFGGKAQIDKMKSLDFMIGDWKGTGQYEVGGRKIEVESTERVESVAGGTCFFVIGKHWMKGPEGQRLLIHDAAAMLRYDLALSKFVMRSQLANGLNLEAEVAVGDRGVSWGMKTETSGATRFTMKLTERGEWHEIGERSTDNGATWTKYMEMTLKKQ